MSSYSEISALVRLNEQIKKSSEKQNELLERIAVALEKIADAQEKQVR